MKGSKLLVGALALGAAAFLASSASATMPMMKDAKKAGIEMKDGCLHCHVDKLPKKDKADLNDRGKWLMAEKEKRQAEEIDVAWLKDYVEPKAGE